MRKRKFGPFLLALVAVLVSTTVLYFLTVQPAFARELFYWYTTLVDFNEGNFYHTGLSWREDGEVQLLPIGIGQPWEPGNNTGLPNRAGMGVAVYRNHIYVVGGDQEYGDTCNEVFFTTIYSDVTTISQRLSDWHVTTPLPLSAYPYGAWRMEAVALNGYLYVFGGTTIEGTGGDYANILYSQIQPDGTLGAWQNNPTPLPVQMYGMESVVLYNRIYVLGGGDPIGNSRRNVYIFDQSLNGQLSMRETTSLPLIGGTPMYLESSVAAAQGRLYVFGGAESTNCGDTCLSPYVHFARPLSTTGEITSGGWILAETSLPQNSFASEGAAYESGLLLAVAGAWNNVAVPSPDVRVSLIDWDGQPSEWATTIALPTGRYWHGVVMDPWGWMYCIGGTTAMGQNGQRLNEVQIVRPYSGGGGQGGPQQIETVLHHTEEETPTIYAPNGYFTSYPINVQPVEGVPSTLTSLNWGTTISNPTEMTITLSYRYKLGVNWTAWSPPFNTAPGIGDVTTTITLTGQADYFQFRAYLTGTDDITNTSVVTETPFLNWVKVGVLAPPDLVATGLTTTGCEGCPGFVRPGEPFTIELTFQNQSTDVISRNAFFAMVFITTTPGFVPMAPDLPAQCEGYITVTDCPFVWDFQGWKIKEGYITETSVMYTIEDPGIYYIIGYVDYNDAMTETWPLYNVRELDEFNNYIRIQIDVGVTRVYLPLIFKGKIP